MLIITKYHILDPPSRYRRVTLISVTWPRPLLASVHVPCHDSCLYASLTSRNTGSSMDNHAVCTASWPAECYQLPLVVMSALLPCQLQSQVTACEVPTPTIKGASAYNPHQPTTSFANTLPFAINCLVDYLSCFPSSNTNLLHKHHTFAQHVTPPSTCAAANTAPSNNSRATPEEPDCF